MTLTRNFLAVSLAWLLVFVFSTRMAPANKLVGHPHAVSRTVFFEEKSDFKPGRFFRTRLNSKNEITLSAENGDFITSGSFTSPVMRSPFPLTELIPSWNVDVPTSTGFTVYMKLGEAGREWTDWLYLGRYGLTPKISGKNISSRGAEVDVDYLLLEKPFVYYQWRVELFSRRPNYIPRLKLFTVTLGNASGDEELYKQFTPKPRPGNNWARRLDVPYRSQLHKDRAIPKRMRWAICCPVSVSMVLEFFGHDLATRKVCDLCFDHDYTMWGAWPRASQTLSRFGLRSYVMQIRHFDEIKEFISKGSPMIISIRAKEGELTSPPYSQAPGHILVISGLDKDENVWVNDPYNLDGKSGPRKWTRKEIEKVLIARGGVAIIAEKINH